MSFAAVVVAAGTGSRAGAGPAKQWRMLAGRPVLRWSVEALASAGAEAIVVAIGPGDEVQAAELLKDIAVVRVTTGGAARADSVRAGLEAMAAHPPERVLIHDAARPFVTPRHIASLLAALDEAEGAVPVLPVADTLKRGSALLQAA